MPVMYLTIKSSCGYYLTGKQSEKMNISCTTTKLYAYVILYIFSSYEYTYSYNQALRKKD